MHRVSFAILLLLALIPISAFSQTESPDPGRRRHRKGHLLKRADKNGDGQISRDEWKRNTRAFERLDRNHDGVIAGDEAQAALRERRERRMKALERIDKNNDGGISREEWPGRRERFDRLDQNHDGVVTRDELAANRHHRRRG